MPLRILLTDDHGVLRAGLSSLLSAENDLMVIGEAESGEQAIERTVSLKPDIVLMDIALPNLDGIEATRVIKKEVPQVKVLMLTFHEDRTMLLEALKAGASGFILKRALKNELLEAIRAVANGGIYVHSSMAHAFLPEHDPPSNHHKSTSPEELTQREIEVMRLIAQGYTNSQSAQMLNVSVRTIEYHRSNLMSKLNLSSRVELMRYAQEHNLL